MAFNLTVLIENCMLQDLRKKSEFENGQKTGEKTVVDVVFLGDKPLTCEVPADMVSGLKLHTWGVVRIAELSVMNPREWTTDDGRTGFSYSKVSGKFMFIEFAQNPGK